jgi:hypothetical protein
MRYVNRWSVTAVWVAAVVVAWLALPDLLSVSTWALALVGIPLLLLAAGTFWEGSRPVPSFGQSRVADSSEEAAPRRRP